MILRVRKPQRTLNETAPSSYEGQLENLEKKFVGRSDVTWVTTSGTRNIPKKIPYTKRRIKLINKTFLKAMITLTSGIKDVKTFFVFSSLDSDDSLTASMINERRQPLRIELLQAPYRYLQTPEGKALRNKYGNLIARFLVIVISKPRILYATNPSTITHFVGEVNENWETIRSNLRVFLNDSKALRAALKLRDGDAAGRLERLCFEEKFDPVFLEDLKAIITWDGGYVRPFVEDIKRVFPKVKHIPMYSMSTETVETVPHLINGEIFFLPIMKGSHYEFMDDRGRISLPSELKAGQSYTMIVTDEWGLNRYDTGDIFLVRKMISGWPDLSFLRRRDITASLTGEKITEAQVLLLFEILRSHFPDLKDSSLSLYPEYNGEESGYCLVVINGLVSDKISHFAEETLQSINTEYSGKVISGRLKPIKIRKLTMSELAVIMNQSHRWESQFKVLPLYEKPVVSNS